MNSNESPGRKPSLSHSDRRLRIQHLSPPLQSYTVRIVAVALFACLVIVLFGLGLYPFETTIEIPENFSPIPASLAVPFSLPPILLTGLGLVAGALFYASYQAGWKLAVPTRLAIGVLTLAFPLSLLSYSLNTNLTWTAEGTFRFALILLATGCGAAASLSAFFSSPRAARWGARFSTGSFLIMALAFLMFYLWWNSLASQGQMSGEVASVIYLPVVTLVAYLAPFVWLVEIIFFWQALTEAKIFSRDIGVRIANISERIPWLLAALFAIKIAWLLVGYWGILPGPAAEPWQGSRQDGLIGWLFAALFALAAGGWLANRHRKVEGTSFSKAAVLLTGGFLLPFLAAFLLFIPATVFSSLQMERVGLFLGSASDRLAGIGALWSVIFAAALLPLGFFFLPSPKSRPLAPVFLLTGLWALPSVIQFLIPGLGSSFEYLTFDVALTLVLLGLALLRWRGKLTRINYWNLTLILVVSTLVGLAESLIPENYSTLGFAVILVLPMLYQLFFDSAGLNAAGDTQGSRLLRTLGFQAGLMLVIVWAVVLGLKSPEQAVWETVANKIFLPPILALLLAAILTNRESVPPIGAGDAL